MSPSHEHHHSDNGFEYPSLAHRGRHLFIPAAAVASALTAAHQMGLVFSIGAVAAWLLCFFFTGLAVSHDWKVCPYCHQPPRSEATPSARAKLARYRHSRARQRITAVIRTAVVLHALLPKPYMNPWWAKAAAGLLYFLIAVAFTTSVVRLTRHDRYRQECHIEWCRAGLKRTPGLTARRRRMMWRAHYGVWILAAVAPAACAIGLFATTHHDLVPHIAYGVLLTILLAITRSITVQHPNIPCLYCARRLPDNPELAAEQRMGMLRLFHRTRRAARGFALVAWVVSWAVAGTVTAKVLVCSAALAVLYWTVLERVHSPVKPWCPWCKDNGGDDAGCDVPDPSSSVPSLT